MLSRSVTADDKPAGRRARIATVASIAIAAATLAGCGGSASALASSRPSASASSRPSASASARPSASASARPSASASARPSGSASALDTGIAAVSAGPATSCHAVVHIGDSTSDGLVLPAYQPDAGLRIAAQYRRVGVTRFIPEVSGARSIIETWHGFPNAYTVAQQQIRRGYRGCWVLALGTNDTADVAVGSTIGLAARIRRMMSLIGNEPALWINVVSLLSSGPYSEAHMRQWDRALIQACAQYPTMRVYNWAAVAERSWFIPDGIHYTPQGYAERSRLIANALAHAFPTVQPPPQTTLPLAHPGALAAMIHPACVVS